MRKYSFTDNNGKTWERIDKKTARTAYTLGTVKQYDYSVLEG